jgi:chromosome segregation ATPase
MDADDEIPPGAFTPAYEQFHGSGQEQGLLKACEEAVGVLDADGRNLLSHYTQKTYDEDEHLRVEGIAAEISGSIDALRSKLPSKEDIKAFYQRLGASTEGREKAIDSMVARIIGLMDRHPELRYELRQKLQDYNDVTRDEAQELRKQCQQVAEAWKLMEQQQESASRRIEDLTEQWSAYLKNSALWNEQCAKVEGLKQQLKDQRETHTEEADRLSVRLSAAMAQASELDTLRRSLETFGLKGDLPELQSQLDSDQADRKAKSSEGSNLTSELARSREIGARRGEALRAFGKKQEESEAESEKLSKQLSSTTSLYNEVKEQLASESLSLSTANKRCQLLEQCLNTTEAQLTEVTRQNAHLTDQVSSTSSELEKAWTERIETETQRDTFKEQAEAVTSELSQLQTDNQRLKKRCETSDREVSAWQKKYAQLGDDSEETKKQHHVLVSQLQGELQTRTSDLDEASQNCESLRKALASKAEALKTAKSAFQELDRELQAKAKVLTASELARETLKVELKSKGEELTVARDANKALERDLGSKAAGLATANQQCTMLHADVEAKAGEVRQANEACEKLKTELESMATEVTQLNEDRNMLREDLASQARDVTRAHDQCTTLQDDVDSKTERLKASDAKCANLQILLDSGNEHLTKAAEEQRELRAALESKTFQLAEATEESSRLGSEAKCRDLELAAARQECTDLRKQLAHVKCMSHLDAARSSCIFIEVLCDSMVDLSTAVAETLRGIESQAGHVSQGIAAVTAGLLRGDQFDVSEDLLPRVYSLAWTIAESYESACSPLEELMVICFFNAVVNIFREEPLKSDLIGKFEQMKGSLRGQLGITEWFWTKSSNHFSSSKTGWRRSSPRLRPLLIWQSRLRTITFTWMASTWL